MARIRRTVYLQSEWSIPFESNVEKGTKNSSEKMKLSDHKTMTEANAAATKARKTYKAAIAVKRKDGTATVYVGKRK